MRKYFTCSCGKTITTYRNDGYPILYCEDCDYSLHAAGPVDFWFLYSFKDGNWTRYKVYHDGDKDILGEFRKLSCPRLWAHWSIYRGFQVMRFDWTPDLGFDNPPEALIRQTHYIHDVEQDCCNFVQEFAAGRINPDDWDDESNFFKEK